MEKHTFEEGDRVINTPAHNAVYEIRGVVVGIKKELVEVRIEQTVLRGLSGPVEDDPWLRAGKVIRSASFLWRKQED